MNAVSSFAGFMKKHLLEQSDHWDFERRRSWVARQVMLNNVRARLPPHVNVTVEVVPRLERTPRGKAPLIVHRPSVHDALRRHGVEPLFTR
jgi:predicted GNAT family acetyltransferase